MSVFVLAGKSLRATLDIHGPMGEGGIRTGMELQEAVDAYDQGTRFGGASQIQYSAVVNFEHLNLGEPEDEVTPSDVKPGESAEERRQRRAEERKKVLEARQRKELQLKSQKTKVRNEGEPFLKTIRAPVAGWYRFCVKATWNQVTAELDLRKESELGGTDDYGHVWTFRQKVMEEEEKAMEEDTAAMEGIKDEDFKGTRDKLKTLRRLLSDIQSKQNQERHRLAVHSATNEHSHSRMALNSLMETILFMVVTGYQVYTIRRWFKGAPVLGR
jgi:hypothetical protein